MSTPREVAEGIVREWLRRVWVDHGWYVSSTEEPQLANAIEVAITRERQDGLDKRRRDATEALRTALTIESTLKARAERAEAVVAAARGLMDNLKGHFLDAKFVPVWEKLRDALTAYDHATRAQAASPAAQSPPRPLGREAGGLDDGQGAHVSNIRRAVLGEITEALEAYRNPQTERFVKELRDRLRGLDWPVDLVGAAPQGARVDIYPLQQIRDLAARVGRLETHAVMKAEQDPINTAQRRRLALTEERLEKLEQTTVTVSQAADVRLTLLESRFNSMESNMRTSFGAEIRCRHELEKRLDRLEAQERRRVDTVVDLPQRLAALEAWLSKIQGRLIVLEEHQHAQPSAGHYAAEAEWDTGVDARLKRLEKAAGLPPLDLD